MANKKKYSKKLDKESKEMILILESSQLPDEIIGRALERLDLLIALTKSMKSRVDALNALLQKVAYS